MVADIPENSSLSGGLESPTARGPEAGEEEDAWQGVLMLVIGSVGILGNGFVIVVIFSFTNMRKKLANMFIINQSAKDALAALLLIGDAAPKFLADDNVGLAGFAGNFYCKIWYSRVLQWGILISSTYNLLAITIERYMMVVYPVVHKMSFTRQRAWVAMVVIWLMGVVYYLFSLPTHIVVDGVCNHYTKFPSALWQQIYGVATITFQFLIPLAIHPTLYAHMVVVLRRRTRQINQQRLSFSMGTGGGGGGQPLKKMPRTQKNLLKTLAIVTVCFFLCWSWNQMAFLLFNLGVDYDLYSNFHLFTITAVNLNCCVNPFVYIFKYDEFKTAVSKLLFKRGHVAPASQSEKDGTTSSITARDTTTTTRGPTVN